MPWGSPPRRSRGAPFLRSPQPPRGPRLGRGSLSGPVHPPGCPSLPLAAPSGRSRGAGSDSALRPRPRLAAPPNPRPEQLGNDVPTCPPGSCSAGPQTGETRLGGPERPKPGSACARNASSAFQVTRFARLGISHCCLELSNLGCKQTQKVAQMAMKVGIH